MAELRTIDADEMRRRLNLETSSMGTGAKPATSIAHAPLTDRASKQRAELRERVAFTGAFDAQALHTGRSKVEAQAIATFVAEDCDPVGTPEGPRWRLSLAMRRVVIERAGQKGLARLARVGHGVPTTTDDPQRRAAIMVARGQVGRLTRLDSTTLRSLLIVAEWFPLGTVKALDRDAILGRLATLELEAPLRALIADGFVGRRAELEKLRRHTFDSTDRRPITIDGPGGIGKSSLIAKVVLGATEGRTRAVVAYLTFDRPELRPDRPLSLLAEAARQLAAVGAKVRSPALEVEELAREADRRSGSALRSRARVASSGQIAQRDQMNDFKKLAHQYAQIVAHESSRRPVLWVLDTFEVAQRVDPSAARDIFAVIDSLRSAVGPRFRAVIVGRAPVDDDRTQRLHLEGLDRTAARLLLEREVEGLGLDESYLDAVLTQIGTNPLSLRLAGELFRQEGSAGLRRVEVRRRLLFRVGSETIQGVLYRRILDHLADDDLRKIANPGLVVRRIEVGVILEVLAGPCRLGRLSEHDARDLLQRFGREVSLVEPAGPGVLVHREDVRQTMLPLIERDDPKKVAWIRRAAVKYHAQRFADAGNLVDKTEELYHRLALGQSPKLLAAAWDADAAAMLRSALEELPAASQAYLAEQLGWVVDPQVFRSADDEAWAQQAARHARQQLDSGDAAGALTLARERQSAAVRPLMDPIVIEALAVLGRPAGALQQVDRTVKWASESAAWPTFVEASVLGARIAEDAQRWKKAINLLSAARDIAHDDDDPILQLAAGVAILRVRRRSGARATKASAALHDDVLAEGRSLRTADRRKNPTLVRDLAAEFGLEAPDLVQAATELVGIDLATSAGRELITSLSSEDRLAFNDFNRQPGTDAKIAPEVESSMAVPPEDPEDDGLDWLEGSTSVEQSSRVGEFLKADPKGDGWVNAVGKAFRHDAEAAAY